MAGPLANVFKITSTIGKITFTVAMDVYGAYEGMRVINQDFSWKDFLTQGGISLLVNIVTHKSFMPNLKSSISSKFKFKVPKVDLPEGTPQGPHGGPELPGGNKTTPHGERLLPNDLLRISTNPECRSPLQRRSRPQYLVRFEQNCPLLSAFYCFIFTGK